MRRHRFEGPLTLDKCVKCGFTRRTVRWLRRNAHLWSGKCSGRYCHAMRVGE